MKESDLVLLVEDDSVDAKTVQRAMKEIGVKNPLVHVTNGVEALEYLKNEQNKRPGIILLDLNMPKMNGIEFLAVVKKDDRFKSIPVVILTTSKEDRDRIKSFEQSVAGYMVKPVDYSQFVDVIRAIKMYWCTSELP